MTLAKDKSVLGSFKTPYEDLKQPKRKQLAALETTKEVDTIAFQDLPDWHLIAGPIKELYKRHKAALWMYIAVIELAYILWRLFT